MREGQKEKKSRIYYLPLFPAVPSFLPTGQLQKQEREEYLRKMVSNAKLFVGAVREARRDGVGWSGVGWGFAAV